MAEETQMIQDAYAAFGRGDIPAILEVLDDDVDWRVPEVVPHGGRFRGRDDVGRFFEGIGQKWEGLSLDVETVTEADGRVLGVARASGTLREGGDASYDLVHLFTLRDGRIAEFREYVDPQGMPG